MLDGGMRGWVARGRGIIAMLRDTRHCISVSAHDFVRANVFGTVECDNCQRWRPCDFHVRFIYIVWML